MLDTFPLPLTSLAAYSSNSCLSRVRKQSMPRIWGWEGRRCYDRVKTKRVKSWMSLSQQILSMRITIRYFHLMSTYYGCVRYFTFIILLCLFINSVFNALRARHRFTLILIITVKLGGRNYYSCFTDDGTELGEQIEPDYRVRIISILGKWKSMLHQFF